jgi:hypothetical protein
MQHDRTCKEKKIRQHVEKYELLLEQQKKHYELLIAQQREQLLEAKKKIEKFENQMFQIAKQPRTTNRNKNQVTILNQLAPYDMDPGRITTALSEHFTEEVFDGGPEKITEMIANVILTDPATQKPRVLCTDLQRRNFKHLDPVTGDVVTDPGFTRTHALLREPVSEANRRVWIDKPEPTDHTDDTYLSNHLFIGDTKRLSKTLVPHVSTTTTTTLDAKTA